MILVTGAKGQVGSDLVAALRARYGAQQVVETDLQPRTQTDGQALPYEVLDVRDRAQLETLLDRYQVDTIYHLAGVLSARGEKNPDLCWDVNVNGLRHMLDLAHERGLKVFWPSSIAVFGSSTPKNRTPQDTVLAPATMYGISKVSGELLCKYYADRYGVDVRSLRLPGIISYSAPPGGGTTDYAVEIFHEALRQDAYTSFVGPQTRLPMMYMPDTIRAILDLMHAAPEEVKVRTSYNLTAVSFSAEELVKEIRKHRPGFTCRYEPDFRQSIADSWPNDVDDSRAREDWGWQPAYGLPEIVADMLEKLAAVVAQAER